MVGRQTPPTMPSIRTQRLELIASDAAMARAAVVDRARLAELLDAKVPRAWPPSLLGEDEVSFADRLEKEGELEGWLNWFVVRVGRARTLIGGCGMGGPPNSVGEVTIGYALLDEFQRKGYATEAVGALIDWAFEDPRTRAIVAQTHPHLTPSIRVLEKNGLKLEKQDGELMTFALRRRHG
jgi:RimJ/RimL family protein N-acetyltransferase